MLKTLLLAISASVLLAPTACAQGWTDNFNDSATASANTGATDGNTTFKTGSDAAREAGRGYVLENPVKSSFGSWRVPGESQRTGSQQLNLPPVVTAMPKRVEGVNTYFSGGSMALRSEYGSDTNSLYLPPTHTNAISVDGFGTNQPGRLGVSEECKCKKPLPETALLNVVTKPLVLDAGF